MKTLLIGRHAKSDWSHDVSDRDRPLNGRGLRDAPKMGMLLHQNQVKVDQIISSPANRALTTATLIAEGMGIKPTSIGIEPRFYESSPGLTLSVLQSLDDSLESVMIFGHNPTWEQLVKFLLQSNGNIVMPTCGLVCLEFPINQWQHLGSMPGILRWFIIPKLSEVNG